MSRLNQIENALRTIEGGLFQKICDAYVSKKENQNIISTGSQFGSNKSINPTVALNPV